MIKAKVNVETYLPQADGELKIEKSIREFSFFYHQPTGAMCAKDHIASFRLEDVKDVVSKARPMYLDAGTKPIWSEACKHPGEAPMCCGRECQQKSAGWGGRNYPQIIIDATELARIYQEMIK